MKRMNEKKKEKEKKWYKSSRFTLYISWCTCTMDEPGHRPIGGRPRIRDAKERSDNGAVMSGRIFHALPAKWKMGPWVKLRLTLIICTSSIFVCRLDGEINTDWWFCILMWGVKWTIICRDGEWMMERKCPEARGCYVMCRCVCVRFIEFICICNFIWL